MVQVDGARHDGPRMRFGADRGCSMSEPARSERSEWRGDLFRSDLGGLLHRLPHEHRIDRSLPDTITVFYGEGDRWVDGQRPVRIRTYSRLPDLSPHAIVELTGHAITGKLQVKRSSDGGLVDHVEMDSEGQTFPSLPAELHVDGRVLTPHSLRVARREHFAAGPLLGDRPASERERITIDVERHLFRLAGRDVPAYLGDLGPRLEIKGPERADVDAIADKLGVTGLVANLPFRSLELLFQDILREKVTVSLGSDLPEIEGKLEVLDPDDAARAADRLPAWVGQLEGARLLLPAPHRIVRMRRYHVCAHPGDERQWTAVETMSGRLSSKVKEGHREHNAVLIRDTTASHRTDVHGEHLPLAQFLAEHGLQWINTFDKRQVQVPFALADGSAFCVKIDDCLDVDGNRLVQCELEAIGSLSPALDQAAIVRHLDELVSALSGDALTVRLRPTMQSKHQYFAARAAERRAAA
jgi:hypothetical protein